MHSGPSSGEPTPAHRAFVRAAAWETKYALKPTIRCALFLCQSALAVCSPIAFDPPRFLPLIKLQDIAVAALDHYTKVRKSRRIPTILDGLHLETSLAQPESQGSLVT